MEVNRIMRLCWILILLAGLVLVERALAAEEPAVGCRAATAVNAAP